MDISSMSLYLIFIIKNITVYSHTFPKYPAGRCGDLFFYVQHADIDAAAETLFVAENPVNHAAGAIKYSDVRAAARTGAGDDFVNAVLIDVAGGYIDAAAKIFVIGEKLLCYLSPAVKNSDVRAAARAGAGDDFVNAVLIDVAGGYIDAAAKIFVIGEKLLCYLSPAVKNSDVRAAARAGAGDDFVNAVLIDVAGGYIDAAAKIFVIGEKLLCYLSPAVKNSDVRAAARAGAGDDFVNAVLIDVAGGYIDAAAKIFVIGEKLPAPAAGAVKNSYLRAAARAGAGDDFVNAVFVQIACYYIDPAAKTSGVS